MLLVLVAAVMTAWSVIALRSHPTYDLGLAYQGGVVAWRTGRPETLSTWISTPFLAMVMALVTRVASEQAAAVALTVLNIALLFSGLAVLARSLRTRLPRGLYRLTMLGAAAFGPAVSSLWWRQLNLVVFGLAVGAFVAFRRGHTGWGGLAAALSLLLKPIVVLLPVFLLVGRRTRRAGVVTGLWGAGLLAVSQVFLALRAHSLAALSPLPAYKNFSTKSLPPNIWVCHAENFSPQSALCRLGGPAHWTLQRIVVAVAVLIVVALYIEAVKDRPSDSWAWFAGACALSPMIGPIAWSHYQVLLAPLFVLLVTEFHRTGTTARRWAALALGFALTELVWQPYGTILGIVTHALGGAAETTDDRFAVFAVAMFAQYVVVGLAMRHFRSGPGVVALPPAAGPE